MSEKKISLQERCVRYAENICVHLAQELHDDIGQRMTAVLLALEQAPYTQEKCCHIASELRAIHNDIHRLSHNLHPPALVNTEEKVDLGIALRTLCTRLTDISLHINCFVTEDIPLLDAPRAISLYRLAQEALNNALKHAHAQRIFLSLTAQEERIVLCIEDDGQGFTQDMQHQGLGLQGMQERMALWQGTCTISSHVGEGSVVMATLPLTMR